MMEPKVRQMIGCEDARTRPGPGGKIDIFGLMNKVTTKSFPCNLSFAAYLCLTDGRGKGKGRIVVQRAAEEDAVYVGDLHEIQFDNDPLSLHAFLIRVFTCRLPGPGLYSVQFVYNEVVLETSVVLAEQST
jgi:hypothetical protein